MRTRGRVRERVPALHLSLRVRKRARAIQALERGQLRAAAVTAQLRLTSVAVYEVAERHHRRTALRLRRTANHDVQADGRCNGAMDANDLRQGRPGGRRLARLLLPLHLRSPHALLHRHFLQALQLLVLTLRLQRELCARNKIFVRRSNALCCCHAHLLPASVEACLELAPCMQVVAHISKPHRRDSLSACRFRRAESLGQARRTSQRTAKQRFAELREAANRLRGPVRELRVSICGSKRRYALLPFKQQWRGVEVG